eukprot:1143328-Pelagomonas_calceolata.AAC.3
MGKAQTTPALYLQQKPAALGPATTECLNAEAAHGMKPLLIESGAKASVLAAQHGSTPGERRGAEQPTRSFKNMPTNSEDGRSQAHCFLLREPQHVPPPDLRGQLFEGWTAHGVGFHAGLDEVAPLGLAGA